MSTENYTLQKPKSYIDHLALTKRYKMFKLFLKEFPEAEHQHVLDVGVTADIAALSSNFFEQFYPRKEKIIALSNQDAGFLETIYPGLRFKEGDATQIPFAAASIDVIFSSAVIEHIGSLENQKKMIAECFRVAKKGVFITTPNRWYPIEVHTVLPFLHWLPKNVHRGILKKIGLGFYANENNLNLLDSKTLSAICNELGIAQFNIKRIFTFGFVSNLILIIKKIC